MKTLNLVENAPSEDESFRQRQLLTGSFLAAVIAHNAIAAGRRGSPEGRSSGSSPALSSLCVPRPVSCLHTKEPVPWAPRGRALCPVPSDGGWAQCLLQASCPVSNVQCAGLLMDRSCSELLGGGGHLTRVRAAEPQL